MASSLDVVGQVRRILNDPSLVNHLSLPQTFDNVQDDDLFSLLELTRTYPYSEKYVVSVLYLFYQLHIFNLDIDTTLILFVDLRDSDVTLFIKKDKF